MTRTTHVLPFSRLSPGDFERLCLALVHREGYEQPEHFGAVGNDGGRDIVAQRDGRRVVFQCKRTERFGPREVETVVSEIVSLPEAERPDELILIATCSVSATSRLRASRKASPMSFAVWAATELDARVQRHPDLVAQFFDLPPQRPLAASGLRNVPSPPPHFLPRPELQASLKRELFRPDGERIVGIHGMGGAGKTVLAAAVAQDADVARAFPDGIGWIALGERPDLLGVQMELARMFGEPAPMFADTASGKRVLSQLLAKRRVLLVLDDVWAVSDAGDLDVVGLSGRLLITTRNREILVHLGAAEHHVDVLSPAQALQFIAEWTNTKVDSLPAVAGQVARECGFLPLALAMIGAFIRLDSRAWDDVLERLRRADLDKIRREYPEYPHSDLLRALGVSVDALSDAERRLYIQLAVFPEDVSIPEAALEVLWGLDGVSSVDARDLTRGLVARSLLQREGDARVRLHDLQRDYLRRAGSLDEVQLHEKLVKAYAAHCERGFASGPNDGYFFEHITHHLQQACRTEELRSLLLDFAWIFAKLRATNVNALLADYMPFAHDAEVELVRSALGLSAHILARQPSQLAHQLLGRLRGRSEPAITALLEGAHAALPPLRLTPLSSSFIAAGGALLRTLTGHSNTVAALGVLPDGRVVSVSYDCTVRVWDIDSGIGNALPGRDSAALFTLLVLPDGRVLTSNYHSTFRIWHPETGLMLTLDDCHVGNALAALSDGRVVAQTGDDTTLEIWNLATGAVHHRLTGLSERIRSIAIAANGAIVFGSSDNLVRIWDPQATSVKVLRGHTDWVNAVLALVDGRIVSAGDDCTLRVWDGSGRTLSVLTGHTEGINALALLPDGRVVSAADDATVRVWDLESARLVDSFEAHVGSVRALAVLRDGRVVSTGYDHTLRVWNVSRQSASVRADQHRGRIVTLTALPHGHVASVAYDTTLRVWCVATGEVVRRIDGLPTDIAAMAALPGDRIVLAGFHDPALRIWDIALGRELHVYEGHSGGVSAMVVLADGRLACCSNGERKLRLWDLASGANVQIDVRTSRQLVRLAPMAGDRLVGGDGHGSLCVFDLATGEPLASLECSYGAASALVVLPNGLVVASAYPGNVTVWDPRDPEAPIAKSSKMHVDTMAVLPDGNIVSTSLSTVFVWNPYTLRTIAALTLDAPLWKLALVDDVIVVGDQLGRLHRFKVETMNDRAHIGERWSGFRAVGTADRVG